MTMRALAARAWAYPRRRRGGPVTALIAVLGTLALITWTVVLIAASGGAGGGRCNPPSDPGGDAGQAEVLPAGALADATPAPASAVKVRVLNGGGQRGQANLVASLLGDLGFTEAAPPANDPRYPGENLSCRGQIRFGPAGTAAARTLSLVLPCTELVRDGRADDSVDLAIGTAFGDVAPSKPARDVLDQLANPAPAESVGPNGEPPAPFVDPDLVKKAAAASC